MRNSDSQPLADNQSLRATIHKDLSGFKLNISLTAKEQPLGILGASGSGKSMTLRCIAGLETPDQGQIILNGRVLFDAEQGINIPTAERHIGLMWQNYALFPHMTVAQNIGFGLATDHLDQVGKFLSLMQLEGFANHYPHQLSGGQQQRVALARALAPQPEALLLDEPISALDSGLRSQLEDLLIQTFAAYKYPTLYVTHNLAEAYRICEDLLVLSEGDAISSGPKQLIYNHPETYKVAQLTECQNISPIQMIDNEQITAEDWHCQLQTLSLPPQAYTHVGIYAHHLEIRKSFPHQNNTFTCWLVRSSTNLNRIRLYLKLHTPAKNPEDYQLQIELLPKHWAKLSEQPLPWQVYLAPQKLILMRS